jgi:NAD(P)-dependent dehydrogenase (short-subunit alcohol dehydrogenase family)
VLITGTSSGLGKTATQFFAARGWNVVATMRRPSEGRELARLANVLVTKMDVEDRESIDDAVADGIARFGRIDVLINNAGFGLFGIFESTPREKIQEQFNVNVFGVMDVTRALLPHFRGNRAGTIINISSGAGVFALPMISLYCASKFALEGYSEALSYELLDQGITVKIVEPGGVVSTNFGKRSASEATAVPSLPGYEKFIDGTQRTFEGLRSSRTTTEQDVAKVIFEAACDRSDRLRYVASEDIKPWVSARRETSEDVYIRLMRSRFLSK